MSARITKPGIYSLSPEAYHADPVITPSLSSSIARLLLTRSPLHAAHRHPRINAMQEPKCPTDAMEYGAIVHRLFLGAGAEIVEVDADDWRGKEARTLRAEAREAGKLPVLGWKLAELERCAQAARDQVQAYPDVAAALSAGKPEQAIIWREGATWCRALVDWLPDDHRLPLLDLKCTELSAAPQSWERRLVEEYALQSAFYQRGVSSVRGTARPGMLFLVIEMAPPFGMSVLTAAPDLESLADNDVDEAIDIWRECLRTDRWPGYPPEIAYVEAPAWAHYRRDERQLRNDFVRERRTQETDGEHLMAAAEGPPL